MSEWLEPASFQFFLEVLGKQEQQSRCLGLGKVPAPEAGEECCGRGQADPGGGRGPQKRPEGQAQEPNSPLLSQPGLEECDSQASGPQTRFHSPSLAQLNWLPSRNDNDIYSYSEN